MMQVILNPGPEFHSGQRKWQGIPTIERASNGRLWAGWYTGAEGEGPGNYVALVTSEDDGRTWSEPALVVNPSKPNLRAFDPCLWHDPLGRLWLSWAQAEDGCQDGREGVWAIMTDDARETHPRFGSPRRLANGVMMNKPTVLSNGPWLFPIALWSHNRAANERHPQLAAERFSNVYRSTDAGQTLVRVGGADVPQRTFDEHMIVEKRDGALWMLVRANYGIGQSVSRDGGVTWSPGEPFPLPGPCSRFFLRRLKSGRLLLVHHDPDPAEPRRRNRLTAFLSEDDGATWPMRLMLDERPGVSYPDGVEDENGRLYVIYDHNRGDRNALGKDREILLAVFTEQDIATGRCVSAGSRLRCLINAAKG